MKTARLFVFGLALAAAGSVWAQYQWIDQDGRRVFSDRPPSADVPDKNIMSQPGGGALHTQRAAVSSNDPTSPSDEAVQSVAQQASGTDAELERKKTEAEEAKAAAETARQKVEQERVAAARAENCKRARNSQITLHSGVRMGHINDKGEREIMNDSQRAAELQRVERIIASNCD